MALDKKIHDQANVDGDLGNNTEVEYRFFPTKGVEPISVKQNKKVNIEQKEVCK